MPSGTRRCSLETDAFIVSEDGAFAALRDAWCTECTVALSVTPDVWFLHRARPDERKFEWLFGIKALGWNIAQRSLSVKPQPPVLLAGEHGLDELRRWAAANALSLSELFDWPGLAYLPFGATRSEVVAACGRAAAGSSAPIPPALFEFLAVHLRNVLDASLHVRHWLENRLKSARISVAQLQAAKSVDPNYLKPQEAMSSLHREMVVRLVTLASSPGLPPGTGVSLRRFRDALATYESAWAAIETRRAELARASEVDSVREHAARSFRNEMARITPAIELVIASTLELDNALASARK